MSIDQLNYALLFKHLVVSLCLVMGMFTLPMSIDWFDYVLLLRRLIVSSCLMMGMLTFTLFTFIDRLGLCTIVEAFNC